MIKFLGSGILLFFFMTSFITPDLNLMRENYSKAMSDKEICKKMMIELAKTKNNSPTHLAYLGGVQTIWANHVFSPINKFSTFKKGKKNIEQAILLEPNNLGLRFIRLSIQKNIPHFLGYKSNINEDIAFIEKNRLKINSDILEKNIDALLKSNK